ncbi:MAG: DUF1292 domain-containing protein [Eubacteriales bacterium]
MAEHTHDADCGCGIGEEELTVTLTLDDDKEVECVVICILSVKEQEYIALLPLDENGEENEEGDVYLYKYAEEDGQPVIDNIETDDEYEAVAEAFDEWLDEQEFEEIQEQLNED